MKGGSTESKGWNYLKVRLFATTLTQILSAYSLEIPSIQSLRCTIYKVWHLTDITNSLEMSFNKYTRMLFASCYIHHEVANFVITFLNNSSFWIDDNVVSVGDSSSVRKTVLDFYDYFRARSFRSLCNEIFQSNSVDVRIKKCVNANKRSVIIRRYTRRIYDS